MTRSEAKVLYQYYDTLINSLMMAKTALIEGGVQSYTIGDRSLTRFDLAKLSSEIDDAVKRRDEYSAIMNGRTVRKIVGIILTDM